MIEKCLHIDKFMEEQRKELEEAIKVDKYFLSEKAHQDVGKEVATMIF